MSYQKIVNFILFAGLLLLVRFWQSLQPWYYGQWQKGPLFKSGWVAGIILTLAAVTASVLWIRDYTNKRLRLVEVVFPILITIASAWVTYQLYSKWHFMTLVIK